MFFTEFVLFGSCVACHEGGWGLGLAACPSVPATPARVRTVESNVLLILTLFSGVMRGWRALKKSNMRLEKTENNWRFESVLSCKTGFFASTFDRFLRYYR